ncbi:MAG TPA: tail fiber domain-containing protein [Candidatus Udaeobacter sp.]|nr:tail fiber domain-containing protein [Candidatus Udaeobacter sp.]
MKRLNKIRTTPLLFFIHSALGFFALCSIVQAVIPVPDGGYPGGNTAEGQNALFSNTTGAYNTGLGLFSLRGNTEGSFNTATGAGTLLLNTAGNNTADGAAALLFNTDGSDNTGIGAFALLNNTATGNTAVGSRALLSNTTGGTIGNINGNDIGPNVAVGAQALESNTLAGANTAVGYQALHSFVAGPVGAEQLGACTAVGFKALGNASGGIGNSAFGYQALLNNTDGDSNIAIGPSALFGNTIGRWNVAAGGSALISNVTGESNTAIGQQVMQSNISGSSNTAVGAQALVYNANGSHNIAVGDGAGVNVMTADRVICIGAVGADTSNSCYIGQIFNATCIGGSGVFIDANNKLGTITSSRRFKDEIKPMEQASETLFALKPVTFHYKKEIDPTGISQFGLVAEEVEKVNPDLVVRDKEGKAYSVRYDQVNAMLLNEFLKEHKKVQRLEVAVAQQRNHFDDTIAELKKEIEHVAARTKDQEQEIQKASAGGELNKDAPRRVANR